MNAQIRLRTEAVCICPKILLRMARPIHVVFFSFVVVVVFFKYIPFRFYLFIYLFLLMLFPKPLHANRTVKQLDFFVSLTKYE